MSSSRVDPPYDVIVAGGGISGLACAAAIRRFAPAARVLCLEASGRTGGTVRTVRRGGFVMEGGPSGFLDKTGAALSLAGSLGLSDEVVASDPSKSSRWVRSRGRLRRFPSSAGTFLASDLVSLGGRARMLLEPLLGVVQEEETVAAFASRRLGNEAAELLVDPIVTGMYAGDPSELSLQATLPHLAAAEAQGRSLLFAFLQSSGKLRPLWSFRQGCQQLTDSLQRNLGDAVVCNAPVRNVRRSASGFQVEVGGTREETIQCRAFVSAAPAWAARSYLAELEPEIAWRLSQVPYSPVAVVALGFGVQHVPHSLAGFGYLVPGREGSPVLGVMWSSSIYPRFRAPEGSCSIRVLLGGTRNPLVVQEPESALVGLATEELRSMLGIDAQPVACQVTRHPRGLPQYLLGHQDRVAEVERSLAGHPGLFVGGNGLRGPGMDALVRDATLQGAAVVDFLKARHVAWPESRLAPHHQKQVP